MTDTDIIRYRLANQHLTSTHFTQPQDIVQHLGAMQAQEFAMARWAIGLRLPNLTDADVMQAFDAGRILRTHLLRPTWHFVSPADIRWMLMLTAPRVNAFNAYMYRKTELDEAIFARSNEILLACLSGGQYLTRATLKEAFAQVGIQTDTVRLSCLLMRAELDGLLCSGPRQGNQFTYALLDERVPPTQPLSREEALAELTNRYFTSRGPATLADFVWWSGLTMQDAKAGAAMCQSALVQEVLDGQTYLMAPGSLLPPDSSLPTFLMPDYDEYGISYKNRTALMAATYAGTSGRRDELGSAFLHALVVHGQIAGSWKRTIKSKSIVIETVTTAILNQAEQQSITQATERYRHFMQPDSVAE